MADGPVSGGTFLVAGAVVAYRDERHLEPAVRSLLGQTLPPDAQQGGLWLIISPGGDRTVEVAQRLASADPERLHLVIEPIRRGKSAAIGEAMRRAQGRYLVLLNGDAVAEPGAVAALLALVPPTSEPFAIMGRPVPPPGDGRLLARGVGLLWDLHHELHRVTLETGVGGGTHLSDELLMLPIGRLPPLPTGVVNDGAFLGAWLVENHGQLRYAADARVRIVVPGTIAEHLVQRRRIHRGHDQVLRLSGVVPTTLVGWSLAHPSEAARMFRAVLAGRPGRWSALVFLCLTEMLAMALARWDGVSHREVPVAWERIGGSGPAAEDAGPA